MSITLYGEALLSPTAAVQLRSEDGVVVPLPAARWCEPLDAVDDSVVARLDGPTIDIGCGPGRFVAGVAERGLPVLGIDVAPTAVALTRRRGGLALTCDVFGAVPGTGRWQWALLMDGNIGIGGAPSRLLRRTAELLAPEGRVIVEVEPPGGLTGTKQVRLETGARIGGWFPWAWVPLDELARLACDTSLRVDHTWNEGGRWFGELARL
jgi:SAM-dependent methyltransferase